MNLPAYTSREIIKPLSDDKILDLPKLKAFADDKLNVTPNIKVVVPPVSQKSSLCGKGLNHKITNQTVSLSFKNPFTTKFRSCERNPLPQNSDHAKETFVGKKRTMLVAIIFSFSHNVFYILKTSFTSSVTPEIFVC